MSDPILMSRRTFIRKGLMLLGAGMAVGTVAYPFVGERLWYEVKKVRLSLRNLPQAFEGWKIVQFSDIHFGFHYGLDELREVIEIIEKLEPDILFFTGDLVQRGYRYADRMIPLLQRLKARGGKWAVTGNHDDPTKSSVVKALQSADFEVLENRHGMVRLNRQFLYIAGLEDVLFGAPDMNKAMTGLSEQDCVLLLVHEPDVADAYSVYPISAQFSGHSHGGQVRVPFYGAVVTPELAQKYIDGLYEVGERRIPLYVNRGVGTSSLPIRFWCRPEITLFHLSASKS